MGKKRSKRGNQKPANKANRTLEKQFNCPFCSHEKSCSVRMNTAMKVGTISCSACTEYFSIPINHLTVPADIYAEWIDACEAVNE